MTVDLDTNLAMKMTQLMTGQKQTIFPYSINPTIGFNLYNAIPTIPSRRDITVWTYNGNPPSGSTTTLRTIAAGKRAFIWFLQDSNGSAKAISVTITNAADVLKYVLVNANIAYTNGGRTFGPCVPMEAGDKLKVYGEASNSGSYCIAGWDEDTEI